MLGNAITATAIPEKEADGYFLKMKGKNQKEILSSVSKANAPNLVSTDDEIAH